ncbi:MAG: ABC transporter ATP-binding protein [Erysipelotrichaceae bacterium]|nr:ABC transporter ATP-binding protein [Erysipelotrichaceae bacterium]
MERIMNSAGKLKTYLKHEKGNLILITVTGLIYNIGMVAGPWFEGQLVQTLADILNGERTLADMLILAGIYVLTILFVQVMRFFKRLFVRKFANNINREMKENLYHTMLSEDINAQETGSYIAKAISDVDACVEGIRKFVTEIFDTGIVMISYIVLLMIYDWRLTLIALLFPPLAYFCANWLKTAVTESTQQARSSNGRLNSASLDRVDNALTYRLYGEETHQNAIYETYLKDYEKKQAKANILIASTQPLYQIISMISVIFIFIFGAKNILGSGWTVWNIAAFSTYLACFAKLAKKSSTAAKLFNSVQKAEVSWKRIQPHLKDIPPFISQGSASADTLDVSSVSFGYPGLPLIHDLSFHANAGEIIGITGAVASGKTALGKIFLNVLPYEGKITLNGRELSSYQERTVSCLAQDPQLFSGTIAENVSLGDDIDLNAALHEVCMDEEVKEFEQGTETMIGDHGVRLSGGQQERISLARALSHPAPLLILDDPFSAVDPATEDAIFNDLRTKHSDSIILLISHRLAHFHQCDRVILLADHKAIVSSHDELMRTSKEYDQLIKAQKGDQE